MKQIITIAKIAGDAAAQTTALFRTCQPSPIGEPMPSARGLSDRDFSKFLDWLNDSGNAPPILYYCRYVDLWSSGDVFERFPTDEGTLLRASTGTTELFCYSIPDSMLLFSSIESFLIGMSFQHSEDAWFAWHLRQAADAWNSLPCPVAIIVARSVLGSTVTDEEIHKSVSL